MKEIEEFSTWLDAEMKSRKITSRALSEKSGIARQTIDNIRYRTFNTRATTWQDLVEALGYRIRIEKEDKCQ